MVLDRFEPYAVGVSFGGTSLAFVFGEAGASCGLEVAGAGLSMVDDFGADRDESGLAAETAAVEDHGVTVLPSMGAFVEVERGQCLVF